MSAAEDVRRRAATLEERVELERRIAAARRSIEEDWRGYLSPWITALILGAVVWAIVAALVRKFFAVDIGYHSRWGAIITLAGIAVCTLYMGAQAWRDTRHQKRCLRLLQSDLAAGEVSEQMLVFTGARRFQEPEHLGLIYFLRTVDDRVFVMFDYESQELAEQDLDPISSKFCPAENLVVVRGNASQRIIDTRFSGAELDAGAPAPLKARPRDWPRPEEFADFSWEDLDNRLSRPVRARRRTTRRAGKSPNHRGRGGVSSAS